MRSAIISTAFAAAAFAAPVVERQAAKGGPNDGVILNYALTLEHLENAFYKEGLAKFSQADFAAAGKDNVFYTNLKTISSDEETHVEFLTTALKAAGVKPVVPNTYSFGITDIPTFLTIAKVLEGVGVSAYLGAAQYIMDATYLTAAGSILTVEARHSAYLRENQTPQLSPFPYPFDTPLDFNEVVTLAAPFITAIAPENGPLPVNGFPAITAKPGAAKIGDKVALTCAKDVAATEAYFITITGSVEAPLTGSGKDYSITVPAGTPAGQAYVVLTKAKTNGTMTPTDDIIVAGPAIIEIADAQSGVIPDKKICESGKPVPAPYKPQPTPYTTITKSYVAPTWTSSEAKPTWTAKPSVYETTEYFTKTYTVPGSTNTYEVYPTVYTKTEEQKPTWTSSSKEEHPTVYKTWTSEESKPTPYTTKSEEKPHPYSTTSCTESSAAPTYYSSAAPVYSSAAPSYY